MGGLRRTTAKTLLFDVCVLVVDGETAQRFAGFANSFVRIHVRVRGGAFFVLSSRGLRSSTLVTTGQREQHPPTIDVYHTFSTEVTTRGEVAR